MDVTRQPLLAGAVVVLSLAALLVKAPPAKHAAIRAFARLVGAGKIAWDRLPGWLKTIIIAAGYVIADLAIDEDTLFNLGPADEPGRELMPGAAAGALEHITHGANIVGTWVANGVVFYRLADGKLAVVRKNGTVRVWRPKKPIVLYSDGAKDLKTMLRADKALDKQARQLAKVLSRRAPKPSSRRAARPTIVVADHHVVGQ